MGGRLFTDYEIAWLRAFWPRYTRHQTHRMFNERFGRSLTRQQIYSAATNHNCGHSAFDGRFKNGSTPPNKGRKGYHPPGSEKGWFAKGQDPINTRPLYSERHDHIHECDRKTPALMIKVPGPAPYPSQQKAGAHQKTRWIRKAVWVWEKDHGPVPYGHVILQLDGDYANCAPANLECVPRSVLARLNDYPSVKPAGPDSNPARVRIAQIRDALAKHRRDRASRSTPPQPAPAPHTPSRPREAPPNKRGLYTIVTNRP